MGRQQGSATGRSTSTGGDGQNADTTEGQGPDHAGEVGLSKNEREARRGPIDTPERADDMTEGQTEEQKLRDAANVVQHPAIDVGSGEDAGFKPENDPRLGDALERHDPSHRKIVSEAVVDPNEPKVEASES
jgi:hypothetical protein